MTIVLYWMLNWYLYILYATDPAAYAAALASGQTCFVLAAEPVGLPAGYTGYGQPLTCPYLPEPARDPKKPPVSLSPIRRGK